MSGAHRWDPRNDRSSAARERTPASAESGPDEGYWTREFPEDTSFLRRHPPLKIAAALLLLCAVAGLAFVAGSLLGYLNNSLDLPSHDRAAVAAARRHLSAARPGAPVTVLILGSDRRQPHGPGHVDSILLARLDPAHHRVALLFIPRDLRAQVPGHGTQTVAAGYRLGGPALALATVEGLTGLQINHFLDVDFQGFIDIVNALGGVHTTVPAGLGTPPGPSWASAALQPGYHLLNGRQLLSFVRVQEDAYGGEGWLADQSTILQELSGRLTARVDWTDPLGTLRLLKGATRNTLSDISGLRSWYDMSGLFERSEHGSLVQVRLTGRVVKRGGVTTVIVGPAQVARGVRTFLAAPAGS